MGWQRYREIDNEYFLGAIVDVLKVAMPDYSTVQVQTLGRAIVASLSELTIHAAISGKPAAVKQAKQTSLALIAGLRAAHNLQTTLC